MAGPVKDLSSLSFWATVGELERKTDSTDRLTRALGQSQAQDRSASSHPATLRYKSKIFIFPEKAAVGFVINFGAEEKLHIFAHLKCWGEAAPKRST